MVIYPLEEDVKKWLEGNQSPIIPFLSALPPTISNQNFWISIFFEVSKKSGNFTHGDDLITQAPGTSAVDYIRWPFLINKAAYWEKGAYLMLSVQKSYKY